MPQGKDNSLVTTFYLVRHAHADWTPDEMHPLSTRGRADAERIADTLESCPVDVVISSPYHRAYETVEPLATRLALPVKVEADLRERRLSGRPIAADDFEAAVRQTWSDMNFAHPGGETNAAAAARGAAVLERWDARRPDGHIVMGTHGNLLALILRRFDPTIGFDFWRALTMPDLYRLELENNGSVRIDRLWQSRTTAEV